MTIIKTTTYSNRWLVFVSCAVMVFMINVDVTVVNLALANIADDFHLSLHQVQHLVSAFFFAAALSFIIFGKIANALGKKRIFLFGIFLFTMSSLLAATANQNEWLIISRFLQGMGFAVALCLLFVIAAEAFPPERKGWSVGALTAVAAVGQALGPSIGGLIIHYLTWHWIFMVNVPLGIFSFIMGMFAIRKDDLTSQNHHVNVINLLSFLVGLGAFLFLVIAWSGLPWLVAVLVLIAAMVSLAIFFYTSFHFDSSLVDRALWTNYGYLKVLQTRIVFMAIFIVLLALLPLYLQNIVHLSAMKTSLLLLAMTIVSATVALLGGHFIDRYGFSRLLLLSLLLMGLAVLAFLLCDNQLSLPWLLLGLLLFGFSTGIYFPASVSAVLFLTPARQSVAAIGLFYTIAFISATVSVALAAAFIKWFSGYVMALSLAQHQLVLAADTVRALQQVASGASSILHLSLPSKLLPLLNQISGTAFIQAFHGLLIIMAVCCAISMYFLRGLVHFERQAAAKEEVGM